MNYKWKEFLFKKPPEAPQGPLSLWPVVTISLPDHQEQRLFSPAAPCVLAQPTWPPIRPFLATLLAYLARPGHGALRTGGCPGGSGESSPLERCFACSGQSALSLLWAKGGQTDPNFCPEKHLGGILKHLNTLSSPEEEGPRLQHFASAQSRAGLLMSTSTFHDSKHADSPYLWGAGGNKGDWQPDLRA